MTSSLIHAMMMTAMVSTVLLNEVTFASAEADCPAVDAVANGCPEVTVTQNECAKTLDGSLTDKSLMIGNVRCDNIDEPYNETQTAEDFSADLPTSVMANYYYTKDKHGCYKAKLNISWGLQVTGFVRGFRVNITETSLFGRNSTSISWRVDANLTSDLSTTFIYDSFPADEMGSSSYDIEVFSLPLAPNHFNLYANKAVRLPSSNHNSCRKRSMCFSTRRFVTTAFPNNGSIAVLFRTIPAHIASEANATLEYEILLERPGIQARHYRVKATSKVRAYGDCCDEYKGPKMCAYWRQSVTMTKPTASGSFIQRTVFTDTMPSLITVTRHFEDTVAFSNRLVGTTVSTDTMPSEVTVTFGNRLVGALVGGIVGAVLLTAIILVLFRRLLACNIRSVTDQIGSVSDLPKVMKPRLLVAVDGDLDLLLSQDGGCSEAATISDCATRVPPAVLSSAVRHLSKLLRLRCRCDVAVVVEDSFYAVEPATVDVKSTRSPETPAAVVVVHREPPPLSKKSRQQVQQFVDVSRTKLYDAWAEGTWREKLSLASTRQWIGLLDEPGRQVQNEQLDVEVFHVYFRVPDTASDYGMSLLGTTLHGLASPQNYVHQSALQVLTGLSDDCGICLSVDVASHIGSDVTGAERMLNFEYDIYELVRDIEPLCTDICKRFQAFALRRGVPPVNIYSNSMPPDVGKSLRIAIVDCLEAPATAAAADDDVATVGGNTWMAGIDDPDWFTSASLIGIDRDVFDIGHNQVRGMQWGEWEGYSPLAKGSSSLTELSVRECLHDRRRDVIDIDCDHRSREPTMMSNCWTDR